MSGAKGLVRATFAAIFFTSAIFGATANSAESAKTETAEKQWLRDDRALVIDAYEYNPLDWKKLESNERLTGFIGKGSDGLPPKYKCSGNKTEYRLCKALWKRYSVAKELYHTRRAMAKSMGLKWGVYHLGRAGNPIKQADHLIQFADPQPDELIAIDIEDNDPEKWLSLADAEIFAKRIKSRLGRYPVLYTNGSTAKFIADNKDEYPLLSRLPLWYARYKSEVAEHFPKGNWDNYAMWQFVSNINCKKDSCPYRMEGTPLDIDINVASMSPQELRRAWPFGGLVKPMEEKGDVLIANAENVDATVKTASVSGDKAKMIPLPVSRDAAMAGDFEIKEVAYTVASAETATPVSMSIEKMTSSKASLKARFSAIDKPVQAKFGKDRQDMISAYAPSNSKASVFDLVVKQAPAEGSVEARLQAYGKKAIAKYLK